MRPPFFKTTERKFLLFCLAVCAGILMPGAIHPDATIPPVGIRLQVISTTAGTGEKPQSKVWNHAGKWWCVLPDSSGTWIRRLDGTRWHSVYKISPSTRSHADVLPAGGLVHILLLEGSRSELVSAQYDPDGKSYRPWANRPRNVIQELDAGIETATIDLDSRGRMWMASDAVEQVHARYSDAPYETWQGPILLADGIHPDDISMVVALQDRKVGVFWSNQYAGKFGFRVHRDDASPTSWSPDEIPASQSALRAGKGMADDHMHAAVGSDGTLYAAVKTSYDTPGYPKIALLIRRPSGTWDPLYEVDQAGTRAIVLLDETAGSVMVIYTSREGAGDIVCRESSVSRISFGARRILIPGPANDATSTRQNIDGSRLVLASHGRLVHGTLQTMTQE